MYKADLIRQKEFWWKLNIGYNFPPVPHLKDTLVIGVFSLSMQSE